RATNAATPGAAAAEPNATLAVLQHPASEQLAVNLKRAVKDGSDQIQIELNPASLGKIEVRLDSSHDGRGSAVISADRPETRQMLNQAAKPIEQSLRDAGLGTDAAPLTFTRRSGDGGANQQQQQFPQPPFYPRQAAMSEEGEAFAPLAVAAAGNGRRH